MDVLVAEGPADKLLGVRPVAVIANNGQRRKSLGNTGQRRRIVEAQIRRGQAAHQKHRHAEPGADFIDREANRIVRMPGRHVEARFV